MKTIRGVLALAVLAVTATLAGIGNPLSAFAFLFIAGNALARQTNCLCVTLIPTPAEMLLDVIRAFKTRIPAAMLLGSDWRQQGLKYNAQYTAHIASVPVAESMSSTYAAATGQAARDLLADVDITVSSRYGAPLDFTNLSLISDKKNEYDKVINGTGYSLAKVFIDDLLSMARSEYFSYGGVYATADCDIDMLNAVTEQLNTNGADSEGRVMIVNSAVASVLAKDSYVASRDYNGKLQGGSGYRQFRDVNGFSLIQEYPSLSLNNGTALTAVTSDATGGAAEDLFTKAAHGLVTGQRVRAHGFSAGTGLNGADLAAATTYYAIVLSSSTFQLATSLANAKAGTVYDVSADGTGGVITPAENIVAFASDLTGIQFLAGPEDHSVSDALATQLGIPRVMGFETVTDPESGITMSAVGYEGSGTGNLRWTPMLLWGKVAGRKASTNAVGTFMDKGGYLVHSS